MLPSILLGKEKVAIKSHNLEIPLWLDDETPYSLVLPSPEELDRIRDLSFSKISVKGTIAAAEKPECDSCFDLRNKMQKKYARFKHSPVFLNRLASVTKRAGDNETAIQLWNEASSRVDRGVDFTDHCILAHFAMTKGKTNNSGALLNPKNVPNIPAALNLIKIALAESNIDIASELVDHALEVDSCNNEVLAAAGLVSLLKGDSRLAVRELRMALSAGGTRGENYLSLATAHIMNGEKDKALETLKIAVAINPINRTAVLAYCDILASFNKHSLIIDTLETYLKYEERDVDAWDRIAKAYFKKLDYRKSLRALEHRASISEDSSTWSNIGVVYWRLKNHKKARQYFGQAIATMENEDEVNWLSIVNVLSYLLVRKEYSELLKLTEALLSDYDIDKLAKIPIASNICSYHVFALSENDREDEAIGLTNWLFKKEILDEQLLYQLMFYATYHHALLNYNEQSAHKSAMLALDKINRLAGASKREVGVLVNNIIFALLETDDIEMAENLISRLSPYIHKDPTATATLGLLHFKKGNAERGDILYREAANLAIDNQLSARINQKRNLELGKDCIARGNESHAVKYLKKVSKQKDGFSVLSKQAKQILLNLSSE